MKKVHEQEAQVQKDVQMQMDVQKQHLELRPFLSLTIHLPPNLFASSSHMGLMPILNRWKSEWLASSPGFTRWLVVVMVMAVFM